MLITVVVPKAIPDGLWAKLLHGQAAVLLLFSLRPERNVVAINVPYHFDDEPVKAEVRSQEAVVRS